MIDAFKGEYRWLSNFAPVEVVFEGIIFKSVEHAYVAAKTLDPEMRVFIAGLQTAGMAKAYGKSIKLRPDWEEIRMKVMTDLLSQKYNQEPYRTKLLETGNQEIIEGNTWGDTFFGVCDGVGENRLGKLIMYFRSVLQTRKSFEKTLGGLNGGVKSISLTHTIKD